MDKEKQIHKGDIKKPEEEKMLEEKQKKTRKKETIQENQKGREIQVD